MRKLFVLMAMLATTAAFSAGEEFKGSCVFGLSEFGVDVKTDCSIRWADPKTGKIYCLGNEDVLGKFLKDPVANISKAEKTYATLYSK
jgi:hypothetical protein